MSFAETVVAVYGVDSALVPDGGEACQSAGWALAGPLRLVMGDGAGHWHKVVDYPEGLPGEVLRVDPDTGLVEADRYRARAPDRRRREGFQGWYTVIVPGGFVRLTIAPTVSEWWGRTLGSDVCLPANDLAAVHRAVYWIDVDAIERRQTFERWKSEIGYYVTHFDPHPEEDWIDPATVVGDQIRDSFEEGADLTAIAADEISTNTHMRRGLCASLFGKGLAATEGPLLVDAHRLGLPEPEAVRWLALAFAKIRDRSVIVSVPAGWCAGIAERIFEHGRRSPE